MTAKLLNIPFVTTYHGSYAGRSGVKVLYNSVMARGDVVIANSFYTASLIRELHPFAASKIVVIHRGTDLKHFLPSSVDIARIERLRGRALIEDGLAKELQQQFVQQAHVHHRAVVALHHQLAGSAVGD